MGDDFRDLAWLDAVVRRRSGVRRSRGLSVATVGRDSRVVVKPVTIARDLGRTIEISSGIEADDRVIENPPDGIVTGAEVRIAAGTGAERGASSSASALLKRNVSDPLSLSPR